MKVLVSCYACSPYKGSEPGMGWNFVKGLAAYHELHVIVESKFESDLRHYMDEHSGELSTCRFYFIRKSRHKRLRKIWPPSYYWFYRAWQKRAFRLAQQLEAREHFDLVHQLNMVGYREPGYLWKLNKPLVWGPMGGMCISPWCLLPHIGLYGMLYYGMRNLINLWQMHFHRNVRLMAGHSNAILAATLDNAEIAERLWHKAVRIVPEVGLIDAPQDSSMEQIRGEGRLKIAWSGQHTPGKALNFLLEALKESKLDSRVELHVVGAGRCTKKWKRQADRLGLRNVVWHGWVSRDESVAIMHSCHLFCITSIADLTSTVLLEALSMGLPVVTLDHLGFSNTVTADCGIKIRVGTKRQIVHDFAMALCRLEADENERLRLARGASRRAVDFAWDKKIIEIGRIYAEAVAHH